MANEIELSIGTILKAYTDSFSQKNYSEESNETDVLMECFGITQELKKENKQYWGRELGMCWQLSVSKIFELSCQDFQPALKLGLDEPADFIVGKQAIDTKYRIGSGDSGTLKKFKHYGHLLKEKGFEPILLFLREDNLPAAITACKAGGWTILTGQQSFEFIEEKTGFDLNEFLKKLKLEGAHKINRSNA